MPPKKTTTTQANTESERLLLAKAITSMTEAQKEFKDSLDFYKSVTEQSLNQVDLEIQTKKQDYDEKTKQLEKEYNEKMEAVEYEYKKKMETLDEDYKKKKLDYDQQLKNQQIDVDQQIREYKYNAAIEILENEFDEVHIDKDVYENLQTELDNLKNSYENDLEKMKTELMNTHKKEIGAQIGSCQLKHKAETAELTASVRQQEKEISVLSNTIDNLKKELAAQRDLTREVAMAGKQGAITQQFGK